MNKPSAFYGRALALGASLSWAVTALCSTPIASFDYHISGAFLQVTPTNLSVPKGIAGSVLVSVVAGGSTNNAAVSQVTSGAYVQAILRGPAFSTPQIIVAAPNSPLLLPPINLVGQYELDDIALVDANTGQVRMQGVPSTVPVNVFDQLLISTVTSQPLTLDQIQSAGIQIDESSFRAVQFNVAFVVNGQTIPLSFPVVAPTFSQSTELIPADQVQAKLAQAAAINQQISSTMVHLPPELQTAGLNLQVQGLNFQVTDPGPGNSLALPIPPIPALMVIPGSIGYLHQFFSVQIFTENGAPTGSGLSVGDILANLQLPPGPDGIVHTNWADPGEDPLRFARIGSNNVVQPTQPVVDPGPDKTLGDADDISVLQPGETGQAQFLVEGLQEGLWTLNVELTGELFGLAAGPVGISATAAGSVLVRNPSFSITFTHPSVVRVGEPYTASITVLNTGLVPANLVQVTLNQNSIAGAVLASNQPATIQLGTIPSGQTVTATYHLVAETTGQIQFSDLTTSDASLTGQFAFSMAVDAQGVPLSPDTIAMPDYVNSLPADLLAAANRVLGQALSIATAPQLPPGIVPVNSAIITRRVLDLAEAGQRVQYGDPLNRVLPDLLRDWQGGRAPDDGFDSLLRTSDAGAQWRSTILADMEALDHLDGVERATNRAPDLAGLGQQFVLAAGGPGQLSASFIGTTNAAAGNASSEPYAMVYDGTNGEWGVTPYLSNAVFTWTFTNGPAAADMAVLIVNTNGQVQQLIWQVSHPPVTAIYQFSLSDPTQQLQVDSTGNGIIDSSLPATQSIVSELPPGVIAVQQDLTVVAGRPDPSCVGPQNYFNYGTVVAVVYSKPMTQASAGTTNSYVLDNGNSADSVQIQPSGRVALLNLHQGVSAIIPRELNISGVTDVRGNALVANPTPIACYYPGTTNNFIGGVAVRGRVLLGSGAPAVGVPVTLTMYDGTAAFEGCQPVTIRVSQALTDSGGNFSFDYVMSGIPYSVSASDTTGLSSQAIALIEQATISTQPDAQQLQQLISAANTNQNSLLAMLSAGSVDQAVAIVQGLDRAVVNDAVGIGSPREGQTVPMVLQFRGRASVTGQVLAADGVTPVPFAAVNLYPDPSSLEMGRGVFADGTGKFSFTGIPLGSFSIQVATSDQRGATVVGALNQPNETTNIVVSLPNNIVLYGDLRGTVYDSDNITPIANATVYVGQYGGTTINDVIAIVNTDTTGAWEATNVPIATWDVVAVTRDGARKGVRQGITPTAAQPTYVNIALEAATTVFGQVQYDNGEPVPNALVASGATLVYTDTNGNFTLQGVPVGSASISAGLQANPAAGIPFTRLGGSSVNVVAGSANYVVVKLNAAGRIFGQVFDAQGNPQPNIRVAIPDPQGGGFFWTVADASGNYSFDDIALGNYTVSAPANAVAPQINASQLSAQLSSGNENQILNAFQQAVTVFVGSEDPLINGDDLNFAPSAWGYNSANLNFDGQSVNADIHFIPQGSVSGTVLNGQGIPIGAEVRLTGLGPDSTGAPVTAIRGDVTSDPATGRFGFTNVLLAGPWGLQAASPFYPTVVQTNGFTTILNLNVSGIVLRFPPAADVNGSIAGHVYYPDGMAAGSNVQVHINVAPNYQILTDSNGFFNTQQEFPAVGASYEVDAFDPTTGLKGRNIVAMTPGITNIIDVHLIPRDGVLKVTVVQASGAAAPGAQLGLDQNTYPSDAPLFAVADSNGVAVFNSLWEGNYSVIAQFTEGSTRLMARAAVNVTNQPASVVLTMGPTGTIGGTFVKADQITPVPGANVMIGSLGLASTDTNGVFQFQGVPLGGYTITSSDPVTGANAIGGATITFNGQIANVLLVERAVGTVSGSVLSPFGTGFVSDANVTISFSDGVTPSRTVTTDPTGAFTFPGSPMGDFSLSANYVVPGTLNFTVSGQANGTLSAVSNAVSLSIQLQPLTGLAVQVFRSDGVTPAQNAEVMVDGNVQDTGSNGLAVFDNLQVPQTYDVTAVSLIGGDTFDGTQTNVTLTSRGTNPVVNLVLPGVGNVTGTVVGSDGSTPVNNAQVTLQFQSPLFNGQTFTALSDTQGRFSFSDVPLGPILLTAVSQALAASTNSTLAKAGQTNQLVLHLGASGTVVGELVRADGVTPVSGEEVLLQFNSQSSNPGRDSFLTGANGQFVFDHVPIGSLQISSSAPEFNGLISLTTNLAANSEVLNLGLLPYDETYPQVAQVTPANGTIQVPIRTQVQLVFNKPLASNSVNSTGIFIEATNGAVTSTVTLSADSNGVMRVVTISPVAPLQSLQTYSVIVLAGDLPGATGSVIGSGPTDLVGRSLAAPFESDFTTADQTPPQLLSIFPSNNAVQIDPAAVPRLVFDKTLNPTTAVFTVTGPGGSVAGTTSVGINGQVLTFLPTVSLSANATYTMAISNVFDLAGNAAVGQPYVATFATVVTIGPTIVSLKLASNAVPLGGSTVPVVAVIATNRPGDTVAFSQDFTQIGTITNPPYQIMVALPNSGGTTIRAIATDQYGNSGQFASLTILVQTPQPPTINFAGVFCDGLLEGVRSNFWTVSQTTPGLYSLGATNGLLQLARTATGTPGGLQNFALNLNLAALGGPISNDFSVQVAFTNALLPGPGLDQVQLNTTFADGSVFLDVYDNSSGPNVHVWNGSANGQIPYTNTAGTFRISRSSAVITGYINGAAIFSQTNSAVLTNIAFVLQNNGGSADATAVAYTGFALTGPSIGSQPVPSGATVAVEVTVSGDTAITNLTGVVGGAGAGNIETTNAARILVQGYVLPSATANQFLQVFAQATDNLGRSSGQQVLTLPIIDGTPPDVSVLGPTNNAVFNLSNTLDLAVQVSDNSSNVALDLSIFGGVTATQNIALLLTPNTPVTNLFQIPLTNGASLGGPFTAVVTATDTAGNASVARAAFVLRGPPPTAQITRIAPSNGPVPSDSILVVAISASSGNGIAQLTANVTGAISASVTTNASTIQLQLPVPPTAIPGQQVQIVAQATDTLGQSSLQQTLTLPVSDGTPPALAVAGPTNDALFTPGQQLTFTVVSSDNSSNVLLNLMVSGSLSASQSRSLSLTPNVPSTNILTLSLTNGSPMGGTFTATFSATDAASNSTVVTQSFVLKGAGPTLQFTSLSPPSGPVPSGTLFVGQITASNGPGIAELTASVSGAATNAPVTTHGPSLVLQIPVPPTAVPGQQIIITAQATDTLGQSSGQYMFNVPVSDGTPPSLALLSPTNGAHLPAGSSFNLAAITSDNSGSMTLNLLVGGAISNTQSLALSLNPNVPATNVFTVPLTAAPANGGPIFAILQATDASSNSVTISNLFWLAGTPGPAIASLLIGSNLPPIAGSIVPVEAILASDAPGQSVAFTQSGTLLGTATNAPFQIPLQLPASGSTTITAIASDQFGNTGTPALLTITVQSNTQPSLQLVRISPSTGPLPSDAFFTVALSASGDNDLFNITATVAGAASNATFQTNGTQLRITDQVLPTASAGQQVQITAQAVDGLGQSTGPQIFNLPIGDGTPPTLTILSPLANGQVAAGQNLPISVLVSDNSSSVTLNLTVTGLISQTQNAGLALTPNVPATNVFNVAIPSASPTSSSLVVALSATDNSGNRTTLTNLYWVPGTATTVTWERQALGQTLNCPTGGGTYTWPSNSNWSQSQVLGTPCGGSQSLPVQPSNWSATNYPNGTNFDVVLGNTGGAPTTLDVPVILHSLTIQSTGGLNMINGVSLSSVNYDFQGDGNLTHIGPAPLLILNGGTLSKSAGTNTYSIDPAITLDSTNGAFSVASGALALPGNASYYTNGLFDVQSGATLALLPAGQTATLAGNFDGLGGGQAQLGAGLVNAATLTLNLPANLFQWMGGTLAGSVTNFGVVNISGANSPSLGVGPDGGSGAAFYNSGLVRQTNGVTWGLGWNSTLFDNLPGGTLELAGDGNFVANNNRGNGSPPVLNNFGLMRKSGGSGVSTIGTAPGMAPLTFNNEGGTIEVDSGTLVLSGGGGGSNGILNISAGAVLDWTGGATPTWAGQITGGGAGQVQLTSGVLNGQNLTLSLPAGLLQWTGGTLAGTATNSAMLTISGTNSPSLGVGPAGGGGGALYNSGLVRLSNGSTWGLGWNSTLFDNLPGGIFELAGDGNFVANNNRGNGPAPVLNNFGLMRKSGGSGVSTIGTAPGMAPLTFNNEGGTIEVDSGTLVLSGGGGGSNGILNISAGAVLDWTGGATPTWAGQITGGGAGQVQLNSGVLNGQNLAMNLPDGLFQWTGGTLAGSLTNSGVITVSGTNAPSLGVGPAGGGGVTLYNAGLVRLPGTVTLGMGFDGSTFQNLPGGVCDLAGDGNAIVNNNLGGGTGPVFNNSGLFRKSSGTNTSTISVPFISQAGFVEIDSGTLSFGANSFVQGAAALAISIGGTNSGQFGQLSAASASLSGPLKVVLTNGFAPTPGQQFMIVSTSSGGITGSFSSAILPFGFGIHESNNAVFVVFNDQSNRPPTLQFTAVTPTNGVVPSGAAFQVNVTASDPNGVVQLTANMTGVASNSFVTTGSSLQITGLVPPTALAGQQIQITAQVLNTEGLSSGPQTFTLTVSDGTHPSVAIVSPPPNTLLPLNQPLTLTSLISDNSTNAVLDLSTFGGLTVTQTVGLALIPNVPITNVLTVPLGSANPAGGVFTVALSATDAAGNATTNTRSFWLPATAPVSLTWQQWAASNFPSSTAYQITLAGGGVTLNTPVTIGTLTIAPDGALNMSLSPSSAITALNFIFQGDGAITRSGCCGPTTLTLVDGTMQKTGGTNAFTIDPNIVLTSFGGTFDVNSGILALPGANSSYANGVFNIASNAALDLVPVGGSATFAGSFTGSGPGAVVLGGGTLVSASSGAVFDLPPSLFQWTGGTIGGNALTNAGSINVPGTNVVQLSGDMANTGFFAQSNSAGLGLDSAPSSRFENLSTGAYQLQSGAGIFGYGCCGPVNFDNFGTFTKIGSASNSVISVLFNNQGGSVDVENGTLTLANNGSSSNGAYTVATGAALDVTGGQSPTWAGQMSGQGAGALLLDSGTVTGKPSVALNFGNGLFQWNGGRLAGFVTNLNVVVLTGVNDDSLSAQMYNLGLIRHTGSGRLGLDSGPSASLYNLSGGTYQFESDISIFGFGCCGPLLFENDGLLRKIAGTNVSTINVPFNNLGGTIEVDSGVLSLAGGGSSSNATVIVASGAALDLTGGSSPKWAGRLTGTGAGNILVNSGTLNGAGVVLDCAPGVFQWSGGTLSGLVVNTNFLNLSGSGQMNISGTMVNQGLLIHTGTGALRLDSAPSSRFENLPTGTYQLQSGSSIVPFGCCGPVNFDNFGTFSEIGISNNAVVSVPFNNLGGFVDVEGGILTLANNGASSNGFYSVAAGATLDLTGGNSPAWAGQMDGQGAGALLLASGTITASPSIAFNFAGGLFQWNGGRLAGLVSNLNVMVLTGTDDDPLSGQLYNAGLIRHTGSGRLGLDSGPSTSFHNLASGIYQFESDSSVYGFGCCGPVLFENGGLLRKSAGTNASSIGIPFVNRNGSIEVDSGSLNLSGSPYMQGTGVFTVQLGGTNAGQYGELFAGNVTLGGPLHLKLAPGFAPSIGSQFQIISASSVAGTFSSNDIPSGFSIVYSNTTVYATVVGQVPGQQPDLTSVPNLSIARFGDNMAVISWLGQTNFVLESASSLGAEATWTVITNSPAAPNRQVFNIVLPITNNAQYFRLRSPQ